MALTEETSKTAADSRNPFYAIIGLNDLFIEQGKAAADRAQARLDAYRDAAVANIATVREELDKALAEGRERANELQKAWTETDSHDIQAGLQEYLNVLLRSYASLVERGERIFEQITKSLGESPVVKRVAEVGQTVAKQVEGATEQAEARVRETLSLVTDKGVDVAEKAADATAKAAVEVGQQTADVALKVADATEKAADKVAEQTADVALKVAETTEAAADSVKETAADVADEVEETATKAAEAADKSVVEQETIDVAPAAKAPARKAAARKTTTSKAPARKTTAAKAAPRKTAAKPAADQATDSK